jgi:tRNA 2-selenouridine synthase
VLGQIGFKVNLIEGGYKAFRAAMVADIPQRVAPLQFKVISGPTGSGKTRLLQALAEEGAQVLDLEALACHRSSVLGHIPGQPQPSQKRFDTLVWQALRQFDTQRPVFVESESRKVGNLSIPESLMLAMRDSPCFELQLDMDERVALLMEDYPFFVNDPALFCHRLDALIAIRGKALVQAWKDQIALGHLHEVVRELLTVHYDPSYATSMLRNFTQGKPVHTFEATNRSPQALREIARALCQRVGT